VLFVFFVDNGFFVNNFTVSLAIGWKTAKAVLLLLKDC